MFNRTDTENFVLYVYIKVLTTDYFNKDYSHITPPLFRTIITGQTFLSLD